MLSNSPFWTKAVLWLAFFGYLGKNVVNSFPTSSFLASTFDSSFVHTRLQLLPQHKLESSTFKKHRGLNTHRSQKSDDQRQIGLDNNDDDEKEDVPIWFFQMTEDLEKAMETVLPQQQHDKGFSFQSLEWKDSSDVSEGNASSKKQGFLEGTTKGGLLIWISALSSFVLGNYFIGAWPRQLFEILPSKLWLLGHLVGAMMFGGGIIATACMEWLVVNKAMNRNNLPILVFWFQLVPLLDTTIVLPGLTLSMVSGTALSVVLYGGLKNAPAHIVYGIWTLVIFAVWWGCMDLTTQGKALEAVLEESQMEETEESFCDSDEHGTQASTTRDHRVSTGSTSLVTTGVPRAVTTRVFTNAVSCSLVLFLYTVKVLKLGSL